MNKNCHLNIRGVKIVFPFVPYKCQLEYMERVVQCLQEGINGLLESPTGTGKTLCLLSATLAWRETLKNLSENNIQNSDTATDLYEELPLIIYASRTHMQLSQVMREFDKSPYSKLVNGVVFGSRSHLCINPTVCSSKFINQKCLEILKHRKCSFYHGFIAASATRTSSCSETSVSDIEDLVSLGMSTNTCPYFTSRERQKTTDILFVPYNYIVDSIARGSMLANFQNSVVIVDEAHNIPHVACKSDSWEILSGDIEKVSVFLSTCMQAGDLTVFDSTNANLASDTANDPDNVHVHNLHYATLQDLLKCLQNFLCHLKLEKFTDQKFKVFPGTHIISLMETCGMTADTFKTFARAVEEAFCKSSFSLINDTGFHLLRRLIELFKRIFLVENPVEFASKFKTVITLEKNQCSSHTIESYKVQHWCFDPGPALAQLMSLGVRSLILTSGTLFPLEFYGCDLSFPITLKAQHVVKKSQIWVGVLSRAVNGKVLNSSFSQRSSSYKGALGWTIINISRISPGGVLVFFPSYVFMEDCLENWRQKIPGSSMSIWDSINNYKHSIQEPRDSNQLMAVIKQYYDLVDNSEMGAIFYAVCRGKVSEGLNFSNSYGRTVVVVGMPYSSSLSLRVKLKKNYLDEISSSSTGVNSKHRPPTGYEWYTQTSWSAVNQAVGRIIRTPDDYGAIIMADERYCSSDVSHLSEWLLPHLKKYDSTVPMFSSLSQFFQVNSVRSSTLKTQQDDSSDTSTVSCLTNNLFSPKSELGIKKNSVVNFLKKRSLREAFNDDLVNPSVRDTADSIMESDELSSIYIKAQEILKLIGETADADQWKCFREICFFKINNFINIAQFSRKIQEIFAEKMHVAEALMKSIVSLQHQLPNHPT